jgi:signal peptidase II
MEDGQSRSRAWAWALALAGGVVAADQMSKQLVAAHVAPGAPVDVLFGFELSNVRNKGVAFGLLAGGETPVLAITLGVLALLLVYFALNARRAGLWIAIGLLAGGALGNLADRVRIGAVIDFLDPPLWPSFNLADVSIVLGVALLALIATERLLSDEPQA